MPSVGAADDAPANPAPEFAIEGSAVAAANIGWCSLIKVAHRFDQTCSPPQYQQCELNRLAAGNVLKATRSIGSPVETCFPVSVHIMTTMGNESASIPVRPVSTTFREILREWPIRNDGKATPRLQIVRKR